MARHCPKWLSLLSNVFCVRSSPSIRPLYTLSDSAHSTDARMCNHLLFVFVFALQGPPEPPLHFRIAKEFNTHPGRPVCKSVHW